jgi:hypothetical protein
MRKLKMALLSIVLLAGEPVQSATNPIEVEGDAAWLHEQSGISFPPSLTGFGRTGIKDFTKT